ncbi:hypothetical protein IWW45_005192 [Coemansia sp. RSA 485]|nr:hypothetical protein IWW45_005192 [Coemansia sp. RSA 485]
MAGGRRRRRNSKTGSIKSAASDLVDEQQKQQQQSAVLSTNPEETAATSDNVLETNAGNTEITENARSPALDDSYDPFAYDSDLETLSSVSSHSSISSSAASMLEDALGLSAALEDQDHEEQLSDMEDIDGDNEDAGQAQNSHGDSANSSPKENTHSAGMIKGNQDDAKSGDSMIRDAEDPLSAAVADGESASEKTTPNSHGLDDDDDDDDDDGDAHGSAKPGSHAGSRYLSKPSAHGAADSAFGSSRRSAKRSLMYGGRSSKSDADSNGNEDEAVDEDETTKFPILESIVNTPENSTDSPHVNGADMDVDSEEGDEPSRAESGSNAAGKEERNAEEEKDALENEARRSAALIELTCIEIEFAKLRERLYSERLQQVQIEEDYLVSGQHSDYERHVEEISSSYKLQMERLQNRHHAWLQLRQKQHESWTRSTNYTYLVQRQELRSRLLDAQRRRLWRLRDMRMQEDRKYSEKIASLQIGANSAVPVAPTSFDEDMALITQQMGGIQQLKRARRATHTAQRCLVHKRKQCLAAPGVDPEEMDSDYLAMQMPLYPRERQVGGFRRIFVPLPVSETGAVAGKKRKPRQPRQPRKKQILDSNGTGTGTGSGNKEAGSHKRDETNGKSVRAGGANRAQTAVPENSIAAAEKQSNKLATAPKALQQGQKQQLPEQQLAHRPQAKVASAGGGSQATAAPVAKPQTTSVPFRKAESGYPQLPMTASTSAAPPASASVPVPVLMSATPTAATAPAAVVPKPASGAASTPTATSTSSASATADGGKGKSDGHGSVDMHVPPGSSGPVGLKA